MSTLKVNTIQDTTGNDALTIDSSGNVTASQGFVPSTQLSHRNLIINGAMQVAQRGTTFNSHSAGYTLDRWTFASSTSDTKNFSQYTITTGGETGLPIEFKNAMKIALTAGSSGLNDLRQKIEFPERFLGQTLTFSFYAKSSSNVTGGLTSNTRIAFDVASNQPATTTISAFDFTTTWQRFSKTITLPTSTTMTTNTSSYLDVILSLKDNTTVDLYITGVQLEVGSVATPFEHRSYGEELALCKRYYEEINLYGYLTNKLPVYNDHQTIIKYSVEKRTTPTLSTPTCGNFQPGGGSGTVSHSKTGVHSNTVISNSSSGGSYDTQIYNAGTNVTIDAEL